MSTETVRVRVSKKGLGVLIILLDSILGTGPQSMNGTHLQQIMHAGQMKVFPP